MSGQDQSDAAPGKQQSQASTMHVEKPDVSYIVDETNSHKKSKEERALVIKCDLVIVPLGALLYFVAYLDRNSIGNARVLGGGMQADLGLTDNQWANCLSMFFVGYVLFMLPGNLVLRKLRPNRGLGAAAITYGILLTGMSAANNYATVIALRVLIGIAQAFQQGITVYTSLWYKRDEIATRAGFIYWAATVSGAFGGLIAYGVGKSFTAENTDRDSWRWLFIIEGSACILVGLLVFVFLPPFPESLKKKTWLFSEREVELAQARSYTYNTAKSSLSGGQLVKTLKDPKSWAFAMMNGGISLGIGSIGMFLPTFIKALDFSSERTQLFSVIPYACASAIIPVSIMSDRLNMKGPFLLGVVCVCCIGYIVLLCNVSVPAKIVAVCIATSGLYTSVILLQAWIITNMAGYTKRATTWAMAEIFGQCLGIMVSHVYGGAPRFIKGHSIVLSFLAFTAVLCVLMMWFMHRENRRKEAELAEYETQGMVHPHRQRSLEDEQDLHIDFRYII